MLIVNNKVLKHRFNEGVASDRAELLAILSANDRNDTFKDALINYTNQIIASNPNHPHASSIEKGITNISDIERFVTYYALATDINKLLVYAKDLLNDKSSSTTVKTQNKSANNTKKSASGVITNKTTKADKDAIVDATINPETDTTSMSDELINKIKSLSGNQQVKILDPLKVSGDLECDYVEDTSLTNDGFYHEAKFDYAINVLIILLRGAKIRIKLKTKVESEDQTALQGASESMKPGLAALLNAIVDFKLNQVDYNNSNEYYNLFIQDPKNNGVNIFNTITGIKFNKISKSSQIKGDLNGIVADKVLGPQKLNLTLKEGYTLDSFRAAIIKGINDKTGEGSSQKINPELAKSLIALVNKVVDETKAEGPSIEELLFEKNISHKKVTLTYEFNNDDINDEEINKARNRIMNDFGEVIGPLALLRYLKGAERVEFGTDYSEAMKDYTIIHNGIAMGVSAKSEKGGNAPDIKPALSVLKSFIVDDKPMNAIVNGQESSITFDNLLANNYVNDADKIERAKGFFKMLIDATTIDGSATLTQKQLITLIDYMCGNESYVKNLCTAMGLDKNQGLFELIATGFNSSDNKCDAFFENTSYTELKNIFDKISAGTGKGGRKGFPSAQDFAKLSNKSKLGYFITPLIQVSIDKANEEFGLNKKNKGQVDIISAVLHLAFNYKQIYLGVSCSNNNITITLEFNQMDVGNWKFTSKAMITDPWKQGILMTMTH